MLPVAPQSDLSACTSGQVCPEGHRYEKEKEGKEPSSELVLTSTAGQVTRDRRRGGLQFSIGPCNLILPPMNLIQRFGPLVIKSTPHATSMAVPLTTIDNDRPSFYDASSGPDQDELNTTYH